MAKWKEIPSPEAIVRAALERACEAIDGSRPIIPGDDSAHVFYEEGLEEAQACLFHLASDPAEVAAILKKAGEDRG